MGSKQRALHRTQYRLDELTDALEHPMQIGIQPVNGWSQVIAWRKLNVRCHWEAPTRVRAALCARRSRIMVRITIAMAALIDLAISNVRMEP
ncbi:hypothetical protein D3C81_1014220 [compost metagenome]